MDGSVSVPSEWARGNPCPLHVPETTPLSCLPVQGRRIVEVGVLAQQLDMISGDYITDLDLLGVLEDTAM